MNDVEELEQELFETQELLDKQDEEIKIVREKFKRVVDYVRESNEITRRYIAKPDPYNRGGSPQEKVATLMQMVEDILAGREPMDRNMTNRYSAHTHAYISQPPSITKADFMKGMNVI